MIEERSEERNKERILREGGREERENHERGRGRENHEIGRKS